MFAFPEPFSSLCWHFYLNVTMAAGTAEEENGVQAAAVGTGSTVNDVSKLPPLPPPNLTLMRRQMAGGSSFVLILIFGIIGTTQGVTLTIGELPPEAWWTVLVLLYTQALIAIVCLGGLIYGDPGVVQRTPENCFPLPPQVDRVLSNPSSNEELPPQSIQMENGDIFCVRCYVWRRKQQRDGPNDENNSGGVFFCKPKRVIHCNVCQRCVRDFDHHCGVFGRCIAGTGMQGNMKYFLTIIAMGGTAGAVCSVSLMVAVVLRFNISSWVLAIVIAIFLMLTVSCCNRLHMNTFSPCRWVGIQVFQCSQLFSTKHTEGEMSTGS